MLFRSKRYTWPVRLDGRDATMCGLGAVFTRPEWRGRGYASELIERVADDARAQGAAVVGLFSEIGESFYRRLGFEPASLDEVTVAVDLKKGGAPAMLVRAGEARDLPALVAMHDTRSSGVRFTIRRDAGIIEYALAKKRLLAALGAPGVRQIEFFVVEEANALPVRADLPFTTAAFAEPLSVALHAVARAGNVFGRNVLVTGAGPIGQLVLLCARKAGAARIVMTDVVDQPLATAQIGRAHV